MFLHRPRPSRKGHGLVLAWGNQHTHIRGVTCVLLGISLAVHNSSLQDEVLVVLDILKKEVTIPMHAETCRERYVVYPAHAFSRPLLLPTKKTVQVIFLFHTATSAATSTADVCWEGVCTIVADVDTVDCTLGVLKTASFATVPDNSDDDATAACWKAVCSC